MLCCRLRSSGFKRASQNYFGLRFALLEHKLGQHILQALLDAEQPALRKGRRGPTARA